MTNNTISHEETKFDILGDIHGHMDSLTQLLGKLGYSLETYSHPEGRKLVFLGDYVDRGPDPLGVIRLVKKFCEQGEALAIMGNHEYNAIAWFTPREDGSGKYCRDHTDNNLKQFEITRSALEKCPEEERIEIMEWMRALPFAIQHPQFRAVHACWHPQFIQLYFEKYHEPISDEFIRVASKKPEEGNLTSQFTQSSEPYWLVETLLKGLETKLPKGMSFQDSAGTTRTEARLTWWNDLQVTDINDCILGVKEKIDHKQQESFRSSLDPIVQIHDKIQGPTIFVGHYWMPASELPENYTSTETLEVPKRTEQVYCLDFSVAAKGGGALVAYRLDKGHGMAVERQP